MIVGLGSVGALNLALINSNKEPIAVTDIRVLYDGPIVKRAEALAFGETYYFTGKPCKYGHVTQRQVCNWDCVECVRIRNSEWRKNNPERVRYLDAKWTSENKERKYEQSKRWRDKNPHKIAAYSYESKSRRRCAKGSHSRGDIEKMLEDQGYLCAEPTCRSDLNKTSFHVDHIIPVSLGGTNWPENLQCLCPSCNMSKGAKHPDEWAKYRGRNP